MDTIVLVSRHTRNLLKIHKETFFRIVTYKFRNSAFFMCCIIFERNRLGFVDKHIRHFINILFLNDIGWYQQYGIEFARIFF